MSRLSLARLASVLVIATLLVGAAPSVADVDAGGVERRADAWEPGPPRYGVEVESDVRIRMSDGAVLAAEVMYPTDLASGERIRDRVPVLLHQTPYRSFMTPTAAVRTSEYFVSRGYVYVLAQMRGTHHSEGDFCWFCERQKQDGVELAEWAAAEPVVSNGTVGLAGCSVSAIIQVFTAAGMGKDSPVKAMAPTGTGTSVYRGAWFPGGAPTHFARNWLGAVGPRLSPDGGSYTQDILSEIEAGGDKAFDRSFWQDSAPESVVQQVVDNGIPALMQNGWHDTHVATALELYAMFQNAHAKRKITSPMQPNQPITGNYQLTMGRGGHCDSTDFARDQEVLKWFDTHLKGIDTGMTDTRTPLRLYELGSDRRIDTANYPLVSRYTTYYLDSGSALSPTKPGVGPTKPGIRRAYDHIRYVEPESEDGTLSYTTAPFEGSATLAGPISLTVYASSNTNNLHLIAEVEDVAPDGTVTKLGDGALIGSMRALNNGRTWRDKSGKLTRPYPTFAGDDYLVPGKVTRLDIPVRPRVAALHPGHSLRLVIKTQRTDGCTVPYPCIIPTHPQEESLADGVYDIWRSTARASHVSIPLRPYMDENLR